MAHGFSRIGHGFLLDVSRMAKQSVCYPKMYITENGTGFPAEDVKVDGKIKHPMCTEYIQSHVRNMLKAKNEATNSDWFEFNNPRRISNSLLRPMIVDICTI